MMIRVAQPNIGKSEVAAVSKVLLSGRYISGVKVREFEEAFARYIGTRYAIAVNSGTAALHIALAALGVGSADEVIVPPLTFFATVAAVLHQNAIPVFADIDRASYCLDANSVRAKVTARTKAIIPVHLYGNAAPMIELKQIARKHKIRIIEDAAQSHGTEYKGRKVGALGDIGCFSFFATKHMTTGEGGMLVTNNKKWADIARKIRSHGMRDRHHHEFLGYNYRMNEIAAAMGLVQLQKLDVGNKKRIKNSRYLIKQLKNIAWLTPPHIERHIKHTFFWCPMLVDEKILGMTTRQLIHTLRDKGIEVRHRYWEPLYKQKILSQKNIAAKTMDYKKVHLPHAEKVAGKIIGLPNHRGLTQRELDYIVKTIRAIR